MATDAKQGRASVAASAAGPRTPLLSGADLGAGAAAAAVVLPQAMAFGVTLLASRGIDPATGALAGLVAAAALCLASGAAGGTRGLISAPTGPTLVLTVGALDAAAAQGVTGNGLLTALAAVALLTGAFQVAIGLSGGGRLIKFIPFSVVAGFMTGSAILMLLSQVEAVSGAGAAGGWGDWRWRWLPAATALATLAVARLGPRLLPRVPGTIAGLIAGTALFQGLALLGPGAVPAPWVIGALPGPEAIELGVSLEALRALPWPTIVVSALALAVLASLDTLLTAVIADVTTGVRHDARRELVGQGIGHALSALAGGMAGAGTTGATVISVRSGGRRGAAACAGVIFVLLVVAGGPVGAWLPVSALAGVILSVALGMVERDILAWARRRRTRPEAVIALLVTVVTVAYDLMAAVGVGVAIAVVLFIRAQVRAPVVHRRSTGVQARSVRERSQAERALLDAHGERIVLYDLRGSLFFGTADRLYDELAPDLDRPVWMILNLRRVAQVDLTAARILRQAAERLHGHGGRLIFCEVHKGAGLGHKVKKALRKISPRRGATRIKTFNGRDEALEYAENALLEALGEPPARSGARIAPEDLDFCREMSPEERAALVAALVPRRCRRGERLFAAGDPGDELFLLLSGEVDVRLPTTAHHYRRLAKYGPGMLFGEIAFIEPGPRTADAVAVRDCELLVLDRERFAALTREHPPAAIAVLDALAKVEGRHLRWAAGEIRRLSEW